MCKTILDEEIAKLGVTSWDDLHQASEEARIPKILTFGKHKGMLIAEAPDSYLDWLLRANDPPIDEYLRKAIETTRRAKGMK